MTEIRKDPDYGKYRGAIDKLGIMIAILWTSFFAFTPAHAASAPASFEQEWAKLIAAAKQEGTVAVASGGAPSRQYRPVVEVFQKKFGVAVEVSTGNATDTVNRVLAERKPGRANQAVMLVGS